MVAQKKPEIFDPEAFAALETEFRSGEYYLTLAKPEDYKSVETISINACRNEVSTPLTAADIIWFNDINPDGKGFLVLARTNNDDAIVAYFLFYPKLLLRRNRADAPPVRQLVYVCVNLYVDPSFRRRQVFANMTKFGCRILTQANIQFLYTVPNQRSAPGFIKLGLSRLMTLPFLARPEKAPLSWLSAFGSTSGSLARIHQVDRFEPLIIERLASTGTTISKVWGERSAASLNWRYCQRPEIDYSIRLIEDDSGITGYIVTRSMEIMNKQTLVVCDFLLEASPKGSLGKALELALLDEKDKIDLTVCTTTLDSKWTRSEFRRASFFRVPQFMLPQPVVVIGGSANEKDWNTGCDSFSDWSLTPYDWDVF
jgi:hypothetical protein